MGLNVLQKFGKSSSLKSEIELPLAPMASVFTVILVFLIKSAALDVTSLSPSSDLSLPEVSVTSEIPDALKIEISKDAILVSDKTVMTLENFNPTARAPSSVDSESPFQLLVKALNFERGESKNQQDSRLVIIADQQAPYQLLKQVMASAAKVGFMDLRLVVVKGGE